VPVDRKVWRTTLRRIFQDPADPDDAGPVRLIGWDGRGIELRVVGYQFADHPDPKARRSWLMIEGTAYSKAGNWSFTWAALTPDDATLISDWLHLAATGDMPVAQPHDPAEACDGCLHFAEPNLGFAVVEYRPAEVVLRIELDLEFSPPWRRHTRAGDPYTVLCHLTPATLVRAAEDWDAEIASFPP
jgi:hypothetical protein